MPPLLESSDRCRARGFTLIELVMVIVLLGILAVFIAPKFAGVSVFNVRGFHDETMAYLRYAQKTAVAQRRTVCVEFAADSITLSVASIAESYNCDAFLTGPRGEPQAKATAKTGVTYAAGVAPAAFKFDGLGQPVDGSGNSLAIQELHVADAGRSIWVEPVTGYVHE
jgi:MSHA pilin protein MshC